MTKVLECTRCGRRTFYEKECCLECGSRAWNEREPGTGTLLAITTVHVSPDGVRRPNRLGLARFEAGGDLVAQLETDLEVGERVALDHDTVLRDGERSAHVGPRFVPVDR